MQDYYAGGAWSIPRQAPSGFSTHVTTAWIAGEPDGRTARRAVDDGHDFVTHNAIDANRKITVGRYSSPRRWLGSPPMAW